MTPIMKSMSYEPSLVSKQIKTTYKVEFNSYIYEIDEYYNSNKELIADSVSVNGTPIGTASLAIRNMLFNFIKDRRFYI